MSKRRLRRFLPLVTALAMVLTLLIVFAAPVSAATLRVNNGVACSDVTGNPYCTIQAAVNAANGGDVIHVYPGTYDESVNLSDMNSVGSLTLVTVNNAGTPTPGTVTVDYSGIEAEFYTTPALNGNLTIDGFVVHSAFPGIQVTVDGGAGANRNVVIQNVTATETEDHGIEASADGNVTIIGCAASNNARAGIYVHGVGGDVVISNCTANGNGDEGISVFEVDGNVAISGCTANDNDDEGVDVVYVGGHVTISGCTTNRSDDDEGIYVFGVDGNVTISGCTANRNDEEGIDVASVLGNVTIEDCIANDNEDEGIEVTDTGSYAYDLDAALRSHESDEVELGDDDHAQVSSALRSVNPSANGGNVTIKNCTANGNVHPEGDADGIAVAYASGDVTIENCTAKGNSDDGIEPNEIDGAVQVRACIAQDNGEDGIDLWWWETEPDSILVNGNIICGNVSDGLELVFELLPEGQATVATTSADATGNWWGCAGGPGAVGCDTIYEEGGSVVYDPWVKTIKALASVDPATVGQPTVVSFQFSGAPPAVYLGQGPGDLGGPAPFAVTTNNGSLNGSGASVGAFVNQPDGTLAVTLVPASEGTATVTVVGPCGLEKQLVLDVLAAEEFVPEPGTALLLASGLAGLAGYAGLRIRGKRQ
jgi:parallel beta-helix repeat protein